MVEIVKVAAVFIASLHFAGFFEGVVEVRGKATEKFRHGKICLGVAYIGGAVNQNRLAIFVGKNIAAPQATVEKAGLFGSVGSCPSGRAALC